MNQLCLKIFTNALHFACILAAVFLAYGFLLRYYQNKSSLDVHFQRFQIRNTSTYPTISMCFSLPFMNNRLLEHEKSLTPLEYSNFVLGKTNYNKTLAEIPFEIVTLQLDDFLLSAKVWSKNIDLKDEVLSIVSSVTTIYSSVYVWRFLKCFSFNIPYDEGTIINKLLILMDRSIFPNSTRPMDGWDKYLGITMYYHLPNQFMKSYPTRKVMWPKETLKSYQIIIYVSNIEIFTRRRKEVESCFNKANYDEWILEQIISSVGCFPPYWNTSSQFPACNTTRQLKKISDKFWNIFYGKVIVAPPCTTITNIGLEYLDTVPFDEDPENYLYFKFFFRDTTYKEITQIREYDFRDLFGDIGGCNGFLLGYALVQVPNFILEVCTMFKSLKQRYFTNVFISKKAFVIEVEDMKEGSNTSKSCKEMSREYVLAAGPMKISKDDAKESNGLEKLLLRTSLIETLNAKLHENMKLQESYLENMKNDLKELKKNVIYRNEKMEYVL